MPFYSGLIRAMVADREDRVFSVHADAPSQELAIEKAISAVMERMTTARTFTYWPAGWAELHPDEQLVVQEV